MQSNCSLSLAVQKLRGHPTKSFSRFKTNTPKRKYSFLLSIIALWQPVPQEVVETENGF